MLHPDTAREVLTRDDNFVEACERRGLHPIKTLKFAIAKFERIEADKVALNRVEKYIANTEHGAKVFEIAHEEIKKTKKIMGEQVQLAMSNAAPYFGR